VLLACAGLLAAIGNILLWSTLACIRLTFPYALEWTENGMLAQVRWIAQGHAPYGPPSLRYMPTGKTPLYIYLSAASMALVGDGFLGPRLVSILAALGGQFLLAATVARETKHWLPGVIAAGLFAASYRFTGAWMDLAKTDSLFLLLLLAAFLVGRLADDAGQAQGTNQESGAAVWGQVASGLLYVAAYYTKQLALPVALVLASVSLVVSRGRAWVRWATAAGVGLILFWVLDTNTDGWFSFYTVETSMHHERASDIWLFWQALLHQTWPALIAGALYPFGVLFCAHSSGTPDGPGELGEHRHRSAWRALSVAIRTVTARQWSSLLLHLALGVGLVGASWVIFFKVWTYDNGFMPACLGLSLLSGMGLGGVLGSERAPGKASVALAVTIGVLVLVQFALLVYPPLEQLPTRADREAGDALVARLSALDGKVWAFQHTYLGTLAGKGDYVHSAMLGDVIGPIRSPGTADFQRRRELGLDVWRLAIKQQSFEWILVDNPDTDFGPYYLHAERVFSDPDVFYTVTGARTRPESLMRRNHVARGGELAIDDEAWDFLFVSGWGSPKDGARPVIGKQATVRLALETDHPYRLQIGVRPLCPQNAFQEITVYWNDRLLGQTLLSDCEERTLHLNLAAEAVTGNLDALHLEFTATKAPSAVTHSVEVTTLRIEQQ